MNDKKHLLERLRALKEGRVQEEELYTLIHEFGNAGFLQAETEVARFLQHDDPELRYIAVNVLAIHWGKADYRGVFEQMLTADPDSRVRDIAASSLGYLLRESRDQRATRLLLEKLRDEAEDRYVREAAFEALLDIWFPHALRTGQTRKRYSRRPEQVTATHEELPDIDWELVAEIERDQQ